MLQTIYLEHNQHNTKISLTEGRSNKQADLLSQTQQTRFQDKLYVRTMSQARWLTKHLSRSLFSYYYLKHSKLNSKLSNSNGPAYYLEHNTTPR